MGETRVQIFTTNRSKASYARSNIGYEQAGFHLETCDIDILCTHRPTSRKAWSVAAGTNRKGAATRASCSVCCNETPDLIAAHLYHQDPAADSEPPLAREVLGRTPRPGHRHYRTQAVASARSWSRISICRDMSRPGPERSSLCATLRRVINGKTLHINSTQVYVWSDGTRLTGRNHRRH